MSHDKRMQAAIESALGRELDRREFLQLASYTGGSAGLAAFIAACAPVP